MVQINFASREVNVKIVYYGPGRSGKTTNLEKIHEKAPKDSIGEMMSIATETDRTLFFDFLPLDLGKVAGMNTKFQLYTVPGQVYYKATRKLVLQGADGVVWVGDSQKEMHEENLQSLQDLEDNLRENGLDINTLPLVFQYNKRDLDNIMSVDEMNAAYNPRGVPALEGIAVSGDGVFPTLKALASIVIQKLNSEHGYSEAQGQGVAAPPPPAPAPAPAVADAPPPAAPAPPPPPPPPAPAADKPATSEPPAAPAVGDTPPPPPAPAAPAASEAPPSSPSSAEPAAPTVGNAPPPPSAQPSTPTPAAPPPPPSAQPSTSTPAAPPPPAPAQPSVTETPAPPPAAEPASPLTPASGAVEVPIDTPAQTSAAASAAQHAEGADDTVKRELQRRREEAQARKKAEIDRIRQSASKKIENDDGGSKLWMIVLGSVILFAILTIVYFVAF